MLQTADSVLGWSRAWANASSVERRVMRVDVVNHDQLWERMKNGRQALSRVLLACKSQPSLLAVGNAELPDRPGPGLGRSGRLPADQAARQHASPPAEADNQPRAARSYRSAIQWAGRMKIPRSIWADTSLVTPSGPGCVAGGVVGPRRTQVRHFLHRVCREVVPPVGRARGRYLPAGASAWRGRDGEHAGARRGVPRRTGVR